MIAYRPKVESITARGVLFLRAASFPFPGLVLVVLLLLPQYCTDAFILSSKNIRSPTPLMGVRGFRSWFESQFPHSVHEIIKASSNEVFDHVLVDVNPLLHICLRKSRTDGHALVLFMKELDAIVEFATPLQSLVLAVDGPPGAAKLATQRKRRYQTIARSQIKLKQIDSFLTRVENTQTRKAKTRLRKLKRRKIKMQQELRTLQLTPATEFMEKAVQAMEYWAWQRLESRRSVLSQNNVTIFISPSTASGEGEIKLLEWINHKPRRGESIALIGGDSDLVLESFLIPLSSTHNVFVLLPDGNRRVLVASIWEATRKLAFLAQCSDFESLIRVRTDFAMTLLLNGNDYLPKIRGCPTFNRLYHTYIKVRKAGAPGYMVDPITLEINLDFAILYFAELAESEQEMTITQGEDTGRVTPLNLVYNLVSSHLLPSPVKFLIDGGEQEESDGEDDEADSESLDSDIDSGDDDDLETESDNDVERHQILLGDPTSEDFLVYETWVPKNTHGKHTRQILASIVLSEMQDGEATEEEQEDLDLSQFTAEAVGYDWEVKEKLPADVSEYLYGLLWNLQTYQGAFADHRFAPSFSPLTQDGVCADYGYNYGKKSGPAPSEILTYLKKAKQNGTRLVPEYFRDPLKTPMPAGLSSMAALPSVLCDLIAFPYNKIDKEKTEQLFAECMSPIDNIFDARKFEDICRQELSSLDLEPPLFEPDDHHWKTLSKTGRPLNNKTSPPVKFSDRMSQLRANNRIRRGQIAASCQPRCTATSNGSPLTRDMMHLTSPGPFLSKIERLDKLEYRLAYRKKKERRFRTSDAGDSEDTTFVTKETSLRRHDPSKKCASSAKTRYVEGSIPAPEMMRNTELNSAVGVLTNLTAGTFVKIKVRSLACTSVLS